MTRETEFNFANLPETEIGRSKFDRSFNHCTTFSNGDLVPLMVEHVMPGDTVNMNMSSVIRMLTPMTPVMDSLYADIFFFYIPYRLIWDNFKYFLGENKDPWTQTVDRRFPKLKLKAPTERPTTSANTTNVASNSINVKPLLFNFILSSKSITSILG